MALGAQDQGPEEMNRTIAGGQESHDFVPVTSMGTEGLPSASLLSRSIGICFRTATCITYAQAQGNRPKTVRGLTSQKDPTFQQILCACPHPGSPSPVSPT